MARLIPAYIDAESSPPGELVIFDLLRDDTPKDWMALHSLDLPRHVRQVEGEIDFLVIVPGGAVICLEVKSHQRVRRDAAGLWHLGRDQPTHRSPFRQASEAMYSVAPTIKKSDLLSGVPLTSAVVFPHCIFDVDATEWEPWQVFDESDIATHGLTACLRRVADGARKKYRDTATAAWFIEEAREPTIAQSDRIAAILRPSFEVGRSPKARRNESVKELRRFTEDQFDALDRLERNPRIVITGAAGTGKTLIAIEAARRAVAQSSHTLLCCYNRLLGEWIKLEAGPLTPTAKISTLHSLMLSISPVTVPRDPSPDFWSHELPDAAATALIDGHPLLGSFEHAVIDEAQDICTDPYLDVIDLLLEGGLRKGSFALFGDFDHQTIYTGSDGRDEISRRANVSEFVLDRNCRNRPRIADLVSTAGENRNAYGAYLRNDDGIDISFASYTDNAEQLVKLRQHIEVLRNEGYQMEDITILSPKSSTAAVRLLGEPQRSWLCSAADPRSSKIRYSTIHAFKGLESPAVIVTDIDELASAHGKQMLYVASSRATDRLVLINNATSNTAMFELLTQGVT